MKREILSVLVGAALVVPMLAEAQRGQGRAQQGRPGVEKLAPITTGGRVGHRARPVARAPLHRDRVVYSSRPHYRGYGEYRVGGVWRPYRDARVRVRLDWGRAPLRYRVLHRMDQQLNPGELRHVLGHRMVNQIRRSGRRAGLRGAPRGYWVDSWRDGLVLVVTMDRVEVAEFIDYDRDGLIDDGYFFRDQRGRRWIARP